MAIDLPVVTFDWPAIVECAQQKPPDLPIPPQATQSTDAFIRNYQASQEWGIRYQAIQQCQTALQAWQAGWEAAHAGLPKDPTAK